MRTSLSRKRDNKWVIGSFYAGPRLLRSDWAAIGSDGENTVCSDGPLPALQQCQLPVCLLTICFVLWNSPLQLRDRIRNIMVISPFEPDFERS